MQHPDSDDLALFALGERLGSEVDAHVVGCVQCTAEVEAFRMTVGLAELSNYGEDLAKPGEHVWQAIATELGIGDRQPGAGGVATAIGAAASSPTESSSTGTGPTGAGSTGAGSTWPGPSRAATDEPVRQPPAPDHDAGSPIRLDKTGPSLRSVPGTGADLPVAPPPSTPPAVAGPGPATARRWSRWVAPLAAAVVGIAVGSGAVIVSQNRSADVTVEAVAPLTPVKGGPLTADQQEQLGKAELVAAASGQQVKVVAPALPASSNDYEVWLFGDDGRMVSLGTLNDGSGTFTVPQGISTREYRVVDVSDEPPDGNPAHSGVSLVRGAFS
ncbi:MAG TPA: anti-sigma factor [Nakamurella sp.]